jgi:hypothetical protein
MEGGCSTQDFIYNWNRSSSIYAGDLLVRCSAYERNGVAHMTIIVTTIWMPMGWDGMGWVRQKRRPRRYYWQLATGLGCRKS